MNDQYGSTVDFKIEVNMIRCEEKDDEEKYMCEGYRWVILGFYIPKDKEREPFWYNVGLAGVEKSPELAFAEALRRWHQHKEHLGIKI